MTSLSKDEIDKRNEAIALFMEMPITKTGYTFTDPGIEKTEKVDWKYNKNWNLLMDAVEKIESLPTDRENGKQYQFSITGDGIAITKFDDGSGIIAASINEIGKSKLQSAFYVISEFCLTVNKQ